MDGIFGAPRGRLRPGSEMKRGAVFGMAAGCALAALALCFALKATSSGRTGAIAPAGSAPPLTTPRRAESATPVERLRIEAFDDASEERAPSPAADARLEGAPGPREVPGLLRVHLVDERGATIEPRSAQVGATGPGDLYVPAAREEPGRYSLRLSSSGTWRIRARVPGFAESWTEIEVANLDEERHVELTLASVPTLRVLLLTPTGAAFENARPSKLLTPEPIATREPPGRWLAHDEVDPERCADLIRRDRTELDLRYLGLLELRCEPPLWVALVLGSDVLDSRRVEPGDEEVVFELDPEAYSRDFAELRFRLVDATSGQYLPNVGFLLHRTAHEHEFVSRQSEDGLRFENVPAGPLRLDLSAPDHARRTLELVLGRGELRDLGEVALESEKPGQVHVRVAGREGVEFVHFEWASTEASNVYPGGIGFRSVDESLVPDGSADVDVPHGRFVVWAEGRRGEDHLASRRQILDVGEDRFDVALELRSTAALAFEPPSRSLRVVVTDDTGFAVFGSVLEAAVGMLRLELVPGEYELEVHDGDTSVRRFRVALPPEGMRVRVD